VPVSRVAHPLDVLIACLRGFPVPDADWRAVIALANRTLLTPALFEAISASGELDRPPADAAEYLRFLQACNRDRNQRLRAQLDEAVGALNSAGICPVLLKGAVPVFICPGDRLPCRITSDLDISVDAAELPAARRCAEVLGYVPVSPQRGMARRQDVGMLELRETWAKSPEPATGGERDGLRAMIPSANSRALHWIMHDLFKEGDYWRGRIDLRHLHDLWRLSEDERVDWPALRSWMPDQHARNAIDTQLLALNHFYGLRIPAECVRQPVARLQHWRRLFTARHRVAGAPLRLAGNFSWGAWQLFQAGDLTDRSPARLARGMVKILIEDRSRI
jgi:hypothetical protein